MGHTAGEIFTHRTCDLSHRTRDNTVSAGTVKTHGIYFITTGIAPYYGYGFLLSKKDYKTL